ncbi:MAG: alanyl-tRNA editing protein [Nitrososphaerota archaeon]|nr:alanyl-tRNA editing protein [Nitrososphaerota archaeon]
MTEFLYLDDHYLKEFEARITEIPDEKSIVLDRTALYPRGGGQPSDHGTLVLEDNIRLNVVESAKDHDRVIHTLDQPINSKVRDQLLGSAVHGIVDWELRYRHMRHHTALHILSGVVYHKFHSKITGGQIYPDRARLDLSLDNLDKERVAIIEEEMNSVTKANLEVRTYYVTTEEALQKKELYRLSADLLPKGLDRLRIVDIVGFDAQLDGGTHVAHTGEVGTIKISKTENKGKDNKRIEIVLA